MIVECIVKTQKEVLILVDLDKKGRTIYRYLYHHLARHGIKINTRFRDFLIRKTTIHQIEDLYKYIRNIEKTVSLTKKG
jgi:5S rRNA maturation endonuclease (ribonuclease M5)